MRNLLLAGVALAAGMTALGPAALAQPRGESGGDAAADSSTRARISVGRSVSGAVGAAGDRDWHRIRLTAGQTYRFTLVGSGEGALDDPYLSVYGSNGGEPIAFNDDADGRNAALDFAPTQTGDYFLEARAFNDEGTGGYTLSAVRPQPPVATASLTIGQNAAGAIETAGERDRYRVRLAGGQVYRVSLMKAASGGIPDPYLSIYQPGAVTPSVEDDDGGGDLNSYVEYVAPLTGDYVIEARSFTADATGGYVLSVRPGDTPADASTDITLSVAAEATTRVDRINPPGDADWFRVELTAGQTIRIQLEGSAQQSGAALTDPMLVVHGSDGAELASDDDGGGGLNSRLEFTAQAAGAHFLEARAFGEGATGGYSLTVRNGEIPAGSESDEVLSPEQARTSTINANGDADWFSVGMVEGRTYRINLSGEGDRALADPMLALHDTEGAVIVSDDDGGTGDNAYVSFTAPKSGTYYAAVSASGGQGAGAYSLRVSDNEVPSDLNTDEALGSENDGRQSRIDFVNDRDAYRISVRPGMRYTVRVVSAQQHGLGDPFVTILNDRGDELGRNDDERRGTLNAGITFTAPTRAAEEGAAIVYAVASGLDGTTGDYTISVAPAVEPPANRKPPAGANR